MFFNSIKEINRLLSKGMFIIEEIEEVNKVNKKINKLLSKRMSNIYFIVAIEKISKLSFSGFKKFVTRLVFGELQLMQT